MRAFWFALLIYLSGIAVFIFNALQRMFGTHLSGVANHGDAAGQQEHHHNYIEKFLVKAWHFFADNHAFEFFIAVGTIGLAFYTARLWGATIKLGQDSERSIKAAETAANGSVAQAAEAAKLFIAANPPRLTIRNIRVLSAPHEPMWVRFMVASTGRTRAIIQDSAINLQLLTTKLGTPDYAEGKSIVQVGSLEPGDWDEPDLHWERTENDLVTAVNSDREQLYLHLIGHITFTDANNTRRRIGFCRRYDRHRKRFDPVDDADFEYAD